MTTRCPDCSADAPPAATAAWLAAHRRTAHNLPRRLTCPPCRRGAVLGSLRGIAEWRWRHSRCGLDDVQPGRHAP